MQPGDLSTIVNDKGCLQAGEEWLEMNLVTVAGVAVGIAFLQVLFSSFSYNCFLFFIINLQLTLLVLLMISGDVNNDL